MRQGSVEKLARDIRRFVLDGGGVLSVGDVEKRGAALKLNPYEIASAIDAVTGTKALHAGTVRIGKVELQRDRRPNSPTQGQRFLCPRSSDEETKQIQLASATIQRNRRGEVVIEELSVTYAPRDPYFEDTILRRWGKRQQKPRRGLPLKA